MQVGVHLHWNPKFREKSEMQYVSTNCCLVCCTRVFRSICEWRELKLAWFSHGAGENPRFQMDDSHIGPPAPTKLLVFRVFQDLFYYFSKYIKIQIWASPFFLYLLYTRHHLALSKRTDQPHLHMLHMLHELSRTKISPLIFNSSYLQWEIARPQNPKPHPPSPKPGTRLGLARHCADDHRPSVVVPCLRADDFVGSLVNCRWFPHWLPVALSFRR